jgi:HEAT repeat protein
MLKTLHFDQPTAWLAAEAVRAPNLWNRVWAVEQLALRAPDPEAGAALVAAAREGGDATVRGTAAQALSRFPAEVALPGLEAAARDTAAVARESAIAALAAVRDPRALALARAAFDGDSSYAVRAAAVTTVAQLDSAAARDIIARALATQSYRAMVQTAALAAALRTADVTLVPTLEERLGDQPLVAIVLAWFGAHGSVEASQALDRHRQDQRTWVRRWVDDALQQARFTPAGAAARSGQ